jgi:predicted metal-dependent hydrolase
LGRDRNRTPARLAPQGSCLSEARTIRLGERDVDFLLKRGVARRRAILTVDERGLTVSVPRRTSDRYISRFLEDSASWVLRKLQAWESHRPKPRLWQDGELVDYLGRQLRLVLLAQHYSLAQLQDGDVLMLSLPEPHTADTVRAALVKWYRRHAQGYFRTRVEHYSAKLAIEVPRVFISNARTQWGSCNAKREVRLSWRLMQAAPHIVDYVVAHELAHLGQMNHSERFWRVVEKLCPDYSSARAELNALGQHFMVL